MPRATPAPRRRTRLPRNARTRAPIVVERLAALYPDATAPLHHSSAFQLLVATILSAQCTDARVNQVTPALFARYPDAEAMAGADPAELEELIRPTGFFRAKNRALLAMSRSLVEDFSGEVPSTMGQLTGLAGVGRKTANVVLGQWFGVPGITVDTHVGRLARRLGLSAQDDPVKIEQDLAALWPPETWTATSLRLIYHGRRVCGARRPRCEECVLADVCPSAR